MNVIIKNFLKVVKKNKHKNIFIFIFIEKIFLEKIKKIKEHNLTKKKKNKCTWEITCYHWLHKYISLIREFIRDIYYIDL